MGIVGIKSIIFFGDSWSNIFFVREFLDRVAKKVFHPLNGISKL
jgi:hypothetical protein